MGDLAFVLARIESYADYTNDDNRRLSDEQIRAYVGEALSRLNERLHPDSSAAEAVARMLLRCQFADQAVIFALDTAVWDAADIAPIHSADRELVTLADAADTVPPAELDAFLARVEAALDARTRMITARTSVAGAPPLH